MQLCVFVTVDEAFTRADGASTQRGGLGTHTTMEQLPPRAACAGVQWEVYLGRRWEMGSWGSVGLRQTALSGLTFTAKDFKFA